MNYIDIIEEDSRNGTGIRVSLFTAGCAHNCRGCFSKHTHSAKAGQPFTDEVKIHIIGLLSKPHISGLTVLGGEPFYKSNREEILAFVKMVKEYHPNKDIWFFSGYTLDQICQESDMENCLNYIDVLIDGKFEKDNPTTKPFRGSGNQRRHKIIHSSAGWERAKLID